MADGTKKQSHTAGVATNPQAGVTSIPSLSEADFVESLNGWLDDSMRVYFAAGAVVYAIELLRQHAINTNFSNHFNAGWNVLDALGGYAEAASMAKNLKHAKRHRREKEAIIGGNVFMSTQLLGTTGATMMANQGVVHGALGAAFLPASAFGFAACMWYAFGRSVVNFNRAREKTDMANLLEDRIIKYENLQVREKQLEEEQKDLLYTQESLQQRLSFLSQVKPEGKWAEFALKVEKKDLENKLKRVTKAIETNEREQKRIPLIKTRLQGQIEAIMSVERKGELNKPHKKSPQRTVYQANFDKVEKLGFSINTHPTPAQEKLVKHLRAKQKEKQHEKFITMCAWGCSAIGMSLIAASQFFPPLFVPGVVFSAIGGAIKLAEAASKRLMISRAKGKKSKVILDDLEKTYKQEGKLEILSEIKHNNKFLSSKQKINYRLAFEKSLPYLQEKYSDMKPEQLEKGYYQKLNGMSKLQRHLILKRAMNQTIDHAILTEHVGAENLAHISDKDKKGIIARSLNENKGMRFRR